MDIAQQLSHQRVKHIVSSYKLKGNGADEVEDFEDYLDDLLRVYPAPLIELALVETLVDGWLTVPLIRGFGFLVQAHKKLKYWETHPIISTLTPEQFHQIAGLDPAPVFGVSEMPPIQSPTHPA